MNRILIAGAGGGASTPHTPREDSDTLESKAMVSLLDLLGEGEIGGLVNGAKSIYLNNTPMENSDGSKNFSGVVWEQRTGTQAQAPIIGFMDVDTPHSVGIRVRKDAPYSLTVNNANADQVRVIVAIPSLLVQDLTTGDTHGSEVSYNFTVSTNGGAFVSPDLGMEWADGGDISDHTVSRSGAGIGFYASVTGSVQSYGKSNMRYTDQGAEVVFQPQYLGPSGWSDFGNVTTMTLPVGAIQTNAMPKTFFSHDTASQVRLVVISSTGDASLVVSTPKALMPVASITVSGKCHSRYQRSHTITLPKPGSSWVIRMTRETADSTTSALANETYFDSYVEVVNTRLSYPNSALVGVTIDSEQFSGVPERSYLVDGLYIKVPNNYDPATRTYSGVWNGAVTKLAISNNPAWILYDLLTTTRYGLGSFISESQIDKSKLYQIGKYCDELVMDGNGGMEPRFVVNTSIQQLSEAYRAISDLTSVFRGMTYWNGGMACFTNDAPTDPSMIYSQANVVEGVFNYSGSARKDRHSVALITWNDPTEQYKQKIEYVEDADLVAKYGIRKIDTVAFGCTSRGQANRAGRWILYTEQYESDIIQFKVGMDSMLVLPGEVVKIHDQFRAGKRMGGRLIACTATSATLDAPAALNGPGAVLSVRLPSGTFADVTVLQLAGAQSVLTWTTPLAEVPLPNAIYLISEVILKPVLARVVGISPEAGKSGEFTITALEHNPSKYALIDSGIKFDVIPTSVLDINLVTAPTDIVITESPYLIGPGLYGSKLSVSWQGSERLHEITWRKVSPNGTNHTTVSLTSTTFDVENITGGLYEFSLVAVNFAGRKSPAAALSFEAQANNAAPFDVENLRVIDAWNAGPCRIEWDSVMFAKQYVIEVWSGAVKRRTDVSSATAYQYTLEMAVHDGGPWRSLTFRVKAISYASVNSLNWVSVSSSNDQVAAITGVEVTAGYQSIQVSYVRPTEVDFAGVQVWVGTTPDFIVGATNLAYDGPNTNIFLQTLDGVSMIQAGITYYVKIAGYDTFGKDAENISSSIAVTPVSVAGGIKPGEIAATLIAAGALDMSKFANSIRPPRVVAALPALPNALWSTNDIAVLTTDSKLYRATSDNAWVPVLAAQDISGLISVNQLKTKRHAIY